MKICHLVAPALVRCQDDTSTLLSMKMQVHSTLEAGVDQLLESVGSRNVTQMSALIQNLVEETISEPGGTYALDGEVAAALEMIKNELLRDIRGALKEAHCTDQVELHVQIPECFKRCEHELGQARTTGSCAKSCDGSVHQACRFDLLELYKTHITDCQALDSFVKDFTTTQCPKAKATCCLLEHTTWNCGGLCSTKIGSLKVDDEMGSWLNEQVTKFENAHDEWTKLHAKCSTAYFAYVEKDAECDCAQAECETINCEHGTCHWLACNDVYNTCWGTCEKQKKESEKEKECLEKDRKVDWSATEKIECYVNVLLEKPSNETLLSECGTDNCYNEYREKMYHKCAKICPEVDFEAGKMAHHNRRGALKSDVIGRNTDVADQHARRYEDIDVTGEGGHSVRTKHRDGSDADVRCTSHLDLDYQESPCCHPCPVPDPRPCEGADVEEEQWDTNTYVGNHYGQHGFLSQKQIEGFTADTCYSGEHSKAYAFNLCPCRDCDPLPDVADATCTSHNACSPGTSYDYTAHDTSNHDCSQADDVHEVYEE